MSVKMKRQSVAMPSHHFPADVLRAYAIGSASDGARLAVACHLAFCPSCGGDTGDHARMMDTLLQAAADPAHPPGPGVRERLLASLPPQAPPPARPPLALPKDLPPLPAPLMRELTAVQNPAWRRLLPGIRTIDLGIEGAWRARLLSYSPKLTIPLHDHDGPEHTVVFSGGLDDQLGHLGRGDAATMMPGDTHRQRTSPGEPCVALVVSERAARPLTLFGQVLKRLTRS
jgi:putative transcriptional regulator